MSAASERPAVSAVPPSDAENSITPDGMGRESGRMPGGDSCGQPRGSSTRLFLLVASVFFLSGALIQFLPVVLHPGRFIRTINQADMLLSIWRVNRFGHQLVHAPWQLFDGGVFFPAGNSLVFSDPLAFYGSLSALLWPMFPDPVVIYNLLLVMVFASTGIVTAFFLRSVLTEFPGFADRAAADTAALLAGAMVAYHPYRFTFVQCLEHPSIQWYGLIFLFLFRLTRDGNPLHFAWFALFALLQMLSSLTNSLFLFLPAAALLVISLFSSGRVGLKTLLRIARWAVALLCMLLVVYWPVLAFAGRGAARSIGSNVRYSATPAAYASMPAVNPVHDAVFTPSGGGHPMFPGVVLAGFAAVSLVAMRRLGGWRGVRDAKWPYLVLAAAVLYELQEIAGKAVAQSGCGCLSALRGLFPLSRFMPDALRRLSDDWGLTALSCAAIVFFLWCAARLPLVIRYFAVVAFAGFVCSFGPYYRSGETSFGSGLYMVLYKLLPPMRAMQAPFRLNGLLLFCIAVFAALGLYVFIAAARRRGRLPGVAAVLLSFLLVLADNLSTGLATLPASYKLHGQPPVYSWIAGRPGDFAILELPLGRGPVRDAEAMYRAIFHGKRIVNGYGSFVPRSFRQFQSSYESLPNEWFYRRLRELGVSYVLYHGGDDEDGQFQPLLNATDDLRMVVRFENDFVFEVLHR